MNWQNCDSISDNTEVVDSDVFQSSIKAKDICIENQQKNYLQLQRLKDPNKDKCRQAYISTAAIFGDWIMNNHNEGIVGVLADNMEAFLFSFAKVTPLQYASTPTELLNLYKDIRVIKRQIKEVNVDLDNATAFQICYYEILCPGDNKTISQFSFEIFSFRHNKISKYRACFGHAATFNEYHHPFIPSRKDLMLAKIKELNYAWADQPDFDKIASLFDNSTEYKIWRWDDQKVFTFYKSDFARDFKNLEEEYTVEHVVPYEIYSEGEFIISNYVFYLEGKHELIGKKFMWLSSCIYIFDKDVNISKINQQGELYQEDEIVIPFKVYSKEVIKHQMETNESPIEKADFGILGTHDVSFAFEASLFHTSDTSKILVDHVRGFREFEKLSSAIEMKKRYLEWEKTVDFFMDLHDPSYDVTISVKCGKRILNQDNSKQVGMEWNIFNIEKNYIENGKVAKMTKFIADVPEPIPSPFDDKAFNVKNILREENNAE